MAAVLQYENDVRHLRRVFPDNCKGEFNALIKVRLEKGGKVEVIQKPSVRPATLEEYKIVAKEMIKVHGSKLKQLLIWNMDEMKKRNPDRCK